MSRRYNRLSVQRPVHETAEITRFTAKVHYYAQEVFGHDASSLASEGERSRSVGNPRFKVLSSLECSLLYRAGNAVARNQASRAVRAEEALAKSPMIRRDMAALHARYDGLDFDDLDVSCSGLELGTKPDYKPGEQQITLIPNPAELVTGYLVEEAQIFGRALGQASDRFGYPETPLSPAIPLVKLSADVTPEERGAFIEKVCSGHLPVRVRLGGLSIDSQETSTYLA
jgi:hypothetical protein